jgi:hypothetical protein
VPAGLSLTQTITQRDARGRLLRVETRATCGVAVAQPALVHVEGRTGVGRDRLNALTRTTHACAKTAETWPRCGTCTSLSRTGGIRSWPYASP